MWHPIERIAKNQFLDPDITRQVADENSNILGICDGMVPTWTVDRLIQRVKDRQGDQNEAIRLREIEKQRSRYHDR